MIFTKVCSSRFTSLTVNVTIISIYLATADDFVEVLLNTVNVKIPLGNALCTYLNELKVNGVGKPIYQPSTEVRERMKIAEATVFLSHEDLDKFVISLLQRCPTFQNDYQHDWIVLESFDRAFWVRHVLDNKEKNYKPLVKNMAFETTEHVCPFSDLYKPKAHHNW